ncbi:MAG: hypothetical protein LUC24_07105, partial [Bacteroidales bacterium]|nr:hypothetical protein [Bacteroidales bacterium]
QGDGTKAIFYYIADGRVDFRQLIKVFAEEFRIRIEMKQIGARQEAGLIGGLGICGRELCCSNYISSFQSITTNTARTQDLSLNPQKLAGQCGKLKCCLNYEMISYLDASSRIPQVSEPLEFEDGQAWLMKTDILSETMYFSYDKSSISNLYPLKAADVRRVIEMNRAGVKPESLKAVPDTDAPEFVSAVGDDSISRFDEARRRRRRGGKGRQNSRQDNDSQNARVNDQPSAPQTAAPQQGAGRQNTTQQNAGQQTPRGDRPRQDGRQNTLNNSARSNGTDQNNPQRRRDNRQRRRNPDQRNNPDSQRIGSENQKDR